MSGENVEALCKHCGQTMADFLQQMAEHNAEVVCPSCGHTREGNGDESGRKGKDHSHGTRHDVGGNGRKVHSRTEHSLTRARKP